MQDKNPHLRRAILSTAPEADADDDSGLPSLHEGEYQAFARASNKPVYAVHFVTPAGDVRSFQYAHLDSDSRYEASRLTLKFMGMEPVRVTIEGRNLWRLYDYLHQHRMPWVMIATRDLAVDGQPIVIRINYATVSEDASQAFTIR
jgi:hypothetical protein